MNDCDIMEGKFNVQVAGFVELLSSDTCDDMVLIVPMVEHQAI